MPLKISFMPHTYTQIATPSRGGVRHAKKRDTTKPKGLSVYPPREVMWYVIASFLLLPFVPFVGALNSRFVNIAGSAF